MARLEVAQQGDQRVAVVPRGGHQVAAAHVEPLHAVEVLAEVALDGFECQAQVLGTRLAQHVEVQPFDAAGQTAVRRQLRGRDAEARTDHTRVIEVRLDGRVPGIDAQAARNAAQNGHRRETLVLRQGVESDMVAAAQNLLDVAVRVDGGVGVRHASELLEHEACLGGRGGGGTVGMAGQFGENAPHGAGLQGDDDLGARLAAHAVDQGEIRVEQPLVKHVTGRRHGLEIDHRDAFIQNGYKINNFVANRVPRASEIRINTHLYLPGPPYPPPAATAESSRPPQETPCRAPGRPKRRRGRFRPPDKAPCRAPDRPKSRGRGLPAASRDAVQGSPAAPKGAAESSRPRAGPCGGATVPTPPR